MTNQCTQYNMKHFDEWAKDKSPLLATAAVALAGGAEDSLGFLQMLKSGELIENILFLPPINQWLNLYRNHRKLHIGVAGAFREIGSETSEVVDFYEFLIQCFNESKRTTPEEKRKAMESTSPEEFQELITP